MSVIDQAKKPRDSLRSRMYHSGLWTMIGYAIGQLIRLSTNLIMARLLMPEVFGLMAIVLVIQEGLQAVSQVGLTESIVKSKRGYESLFLNTAWIIKILRGIVVAALMLLIASGIKFSVNLGLISSNSTYGHPDLPVVLAGSCISILISGFYSTYANALVKRIALKGIVAMELCAQITAVIAMITWALYIERSIWAMVVGGIVNEMVKVIISHHLDREYKNSFIFDRSALFEILQTSRWVFISSLFFFLSSQSDRMILGSLFSPELLGLYSLAYLLSSALRMVLMQIYARIIFPALTEVQTHSPLQLGPNYYHLRRIVDLIIFPLAGVMIAWGHHVIEFLYDDRYIEAGPMLQILSVSIIGVSYRMSDQVLQAAGRFDFITFLTVAQGILTPIMILSFYYFFGLKGVLWAASLSFIPHSLISWFMMKNLGLLNIKSELFYLPLALISFIFCEIIHQMIQ